MPATSYQFTEKNAGLIGTLLDAVVAQDNGSWLNILGMDKISIHIVIANATVTIHGSNESGPADNTDGVDLVAAGLTQLATNATITASTIIAIKIPLKWVKVKVTAVAGSVSAYLVAV